MSLARLVSIDTTDTFFEITSSTFLLGRSADCNLKLEDIALSDEHCVINTANGITTVTDLSTNGTYVNNKRLPKGEAIILSPGDELCLKMEDAAASKIAYLFQHIPPVDPVLTLKRPLSQSSEDNDNTPIKRAKEDLNNSDEPINKVKEDMNDSDEPINKVKEDMNDSDEPIKRAKEDMSDCDELIKRAKEDLNDCDELIRKVKEDLNNIDEPINIVKEDLNNIDEPINIVKEDLNDNDEPIKRAKEDMSDGDSAINIVKEDLNDSDEPIRKVKEDLNEIDGFQQSSEHLSKDNEDNEGTPIKKTKAAEDMATHISCGICFNIMYDCVSLLPCLHTYCAGCYSDWRIVSHDCPTCKQYVTAVKKNHMLQNVIDLYLKEHPEQELSNDEKKAMDVRNTVTRLELMNHITPRSPVNQLDRDGPRPLCRECPGWPTWNASNNNHTCVPGGQHVLCGCCFQQMPTNQFSTNPQAAVPLPKQSCDVCHRMFCHQYWGCTCPGRSGSLSPSACLLPLKDRMIIHPPEGAFNNQTEIDILNAYLVDKNISATSFTEICMEKLADGTFSVDEAFEAHPTMIKMDTLEDAMTCMSCACHILGELAYQYRKSIPKDELPDTVTDRPNCWWGRNCRTAKHKVEHARRLNHICDQTKN